MTKDVGMGTSMEIIRRGRALLLGIIARHCGVYIAPSDPRAWAYSSFNKYAVTVGRVGRALFNSKTCENRRAKRVSAEWETVLPWQRANIERLSEDPLFQLILALNAPHMDHIMMDD